MTVTDRSFPASQSKSTQGEDQKRVGRPSVFDASIFRGHFDFFLEQFVTSTVADFSFRGWRADQHSGDLKVKASRGIRAR